MRGTYGTGRTGWRRSSYSNADGGNCVEVAAPRRTGCPGAVPVRDSKRPYGPALAFAPATWDAFVLHVRRRPASRRAERATPRPPPWREPAAQTGGPRGN